MEPSESNKKITNKVTLSELLIWLPALCCMIINFSFSLQPGDESTDTSMGFTLSLFKFLFKDADLEDAALFEGIIRKLAHFSEYAVTGFFTALAVAFDGFKKKLGFFYALFICAAVSVIDEFIQIFVPGRNAAVLDVIIDCFGAVLGAAVLMAAAGAFLKKKGIKQTHGRREFMNFLLDDISFEEAVDKAMSLSEGKKKHYLVTPNADHVMRLNEDPEFLKIYRDADLVTVDGTPLLWIADSIGHPVTERVTGADMLPALCERAAKEGKSVFFLGGAGDTAYLAADKLKEKYEGLNVAGVYVPPMGFEKDEAEMTKAVNAVNDVKPDILFVCLGMPKQEHFIYDNRQRMEFGLAVACGAAIDFAAGTNLRAPEWMRRSGLEWFYRFLQEPGRLFHRYFVVDTGIFLLAWKYRKCI